ncbi:PREDICTED: adenosine receptor A3-like [Acropora digitifera]|uniref:adenosine receptor A3-like n=1 Tax=Acropora digitifera TaxID=70779 RepID=UPI00077A0EEF|nr:PREDICTED: adenosine receptor A3-like [Acropora digitifera]
MASSEGNNSLNATLFLTSFNQTDGVIWCTALVLVSLFVVIGNVLSLGIFALNKKLRKKSFLLVINMAFADLMLGALALPLYIYHVGKDFKLWTAEGNDSLEMLYRVVDTVCAQASIITATFIAVERFFATGWPLKHRLLARRRSYYFSIALVWFSSAAISTTVIHFSLISFSICIYIWVSYACTLTLVIACCYIGIRKNYKKGRKLLCRSPNERSTKTLLIVTFVVLLSWLPMITVNALSLYIPINHNILLFVNLINFSNSLANPILYSLRISEFRKALFSTARKMPKPSLSRLAAASTAVQLQVAFKDDIDLGAILRKKENQEEPEETEVQSSTREGSLKSNKSFSSDVNRS